MHMKVLIAEDDPVSRRLLQNYLQKWGHEVVAAKDGARALVLDDERATVAQFRAAPETPGLASLSAITSTAMQLGF
jgi:DNA-binding response OmpR family regulator